ncbi:hypothetical protein H6F43_15990 [Leptolyngbya sp. FACHB-36]|nr:hypothetical protein [Leptolyngbya sp. FACHB-36]
MSKAPAPKASPPKATSASNAAARSPQPKSASRSPLTLQKLKNTEYYVVADSPAPLKNGKYQDKRRSFSLGDVVAYGDLNRDGIKDAVTTLDIAIGGRTFTYLASVLNQNGSPKNVSSEFLGERVKVKTLAANAGKITVKMDKYAPGDAACCPSQEVSRGYTFKETKPSTAKAPTPKPTKPQ